MTSRAQPAATTLLRRRWAYLAAKTGSDDFGEWIGRGTYEDDGRQELALWVCQSFNGEPASVANGSMLARRASSWVAVAAFHAAALAHGGTCADPPAGAGATSRT